MARKVPTRDEERDEFLLALDKADDESSFEQKVRQEFNGRDSDDVYEVRVSRFIGFGKKEPQVFECTPDDFPITQRLREQHGSGDYRVRVWKNGRIAKSFQYSIEAAKVTPVDSLKGELSTLAQVFAAQTDKQNAMFERLLEKITTANNANQNQGKSSSVTELVQALGTLDTIRNRGSNRDNGGDEKEDSLERLLGIIKLVRELDGGDRGGSSGPRSWGDIVIELAKSPLAQRLGEIATTSAPPARPALAGPTAAAPTTSSSSGPTVVHEPNAASQEDQVRAFMFNQVAYLVGRAHAWKTSGMKRAEPELYADWVLDNIPVELLVPLAQTPDLVGELAKYVPEVGAHADWFSALFGFVREALTEDGLLGQNGALANGAINGNDPRNVPSPTAASARTNPGGQPGNP